MAGLGNSLYPPIFKKAYMPAFDRNVGCRVYFSLSPYNSLGNFFKYPNLGDGVVASLVQVTVQNQNTNYSALNLGKYPSGIMTTSLHQDENIQNENKYYIIIKKEDLAEGNKFNPGEFYKVQIRFTSNEINFTEVPVENEITESWYNQNLSKFSEWSQVVLIKGIQKPELKLNDFSKGLNEQYFTLQDLYITGSLVFNENDNEYLKRYRIRLFDEYESKVLQDSGFLYSNSFNRTNALNYKIKYNLKNDIKYILKVYIQSNNLYELEEKYSFQMDLVIFTKITESIVNLTAEKDLNRGQIKITITGPEPTRLGTNYIIKRSSSKNNFQYWEDMYIFLAKTGNAINEIWYDKTIESGVWYKYAIQQRNIQGFRSNILEMENALMVIFDDIFLIDSQKQLKIRFDPQINNYSHVVSETLTQTIGSKYPFIRRNGNTDYRSFTLTGTITHFMDIRENGMKASPKDLYGELLDSYKEYNSSNGINIFNDSVYERDFREKVIQFLYKNNVKLYKSTTQGNLLVKLMNISFTPNNTLGRHIYSFSCTIQEIDEFNVENCSKYGIQPFGEFKNQKKVIVSKIGQVNIPNLSHYYSQIGKCWSEDLQSNDFSEVNQNYYKEETYFNRSPFGTLSELYLNGEKENQKELLKDYILPKYQYLENDNIKISIKYLSYLKIEFTSPPYLITQQKTPQNASLQQINLGFKKSIPNDNLEHYHLGYVIYINETPVIVGKQGIYQLSDEQTQIKSVSFLNKTDTAQISYIAVILKEQKEENIPKMYGNFYRIGQFFGYFNSEDSIFKKIYSKYYQFYEDSEGGLYKQELNSIQGLRVLTNPNTAFLIKEKLDLDSQNYDLFIMNQTGLLEFFEEQSENRQTNITGFYIIGPKLKEISLENATVQQIEAYIPKDDQYILSGITGLQDFNDIKNPKKNHVYEINNTQCLVLFRKRLYKTEQLNQLGVTGTQPTEISQASIDTANINTNLNNTFYCIFYNGSWYLFSLDEKTKGVVLGYPTEAIIDYYCQVDRKRY